MARGWESKAIESQQEDRESAAAAKKGPALTPEEAKHEARRQTLTVALARAQADLAIAHHPAHRKMLQAAIVTLNEQLQ
ncbi:MAG: hypothetical protein HQ485_10555 [Acidobacteria bacterium]|nr:hypothetical protein [Acidobacteriota bacterium]